MNRHSQLRGLIRFIYTQNPFYVLSACLVLYGLRLAFASNHYGPSSPYLLAAALCGYTLIMALTGVCVIRWGKVWDDARSILLILLLQFFALSVGFDEFCNTRPQEAVQMLVFGLLFSLVICEVVIRAVGLRFPSVYRIPFYLALSLMFVYPIFVAPGITLQTNDVIRGRIAAFPSIAALTILTLLPAIRRGSTWLAKNGTPWTWPLYPWVAFVFLAFGLLARGFALSLSFSPIPGMVSILGLYHLVPLVLAILVLLLEMSLAEKRAEIGYVVLFLAPALLWMATPDVEANYAYQACLHQLVAHVGSPIWLTVVGLIVFYGYAWCRRIQSAEFGVTCMLGVAVFVRPEMSYWVDLGPHESWPLLLLGMLQLGQFSQHRSSQRFLALLGCVTAFVALEVMNNRISDEYRFAPVWMSLLSVLATGYFFDDLFARGLRVLSLGLVWTIGLGCIPWMWWNQVESSVPLSCVAALSLTALLFWSRFREPAWLYASVGDSAVASFVGWKAVYAALDQNVGPNAAMLLSLGSCLFAMALGITAQKAGVWNSLRRSVIVRQRE